MKTARDYAELISVEAIVEIHRVAIARYGGGGRGTVNTECVEGSLGNAWNAELYDDQPEKIRGLAFAGHLLFYLAKDNCFSDGNKRAAFFSASRVIGNLGLKLDASDDDAVSLVVGVASGTMRHALDVVGWLADHLVTT